MNDLVEIKNRNVEIVKYNGEPVVTTAQLAEFYGCELNVLQKNYSNNKIHYIEGKHYFKLEGEELKQFLQLKILQLQNSSKIRALLLWTSRVLQIQRGRHCPSVCCL